MSTANHATTSRFANPWAVLALAVVVLVVDQWTKVLAIDNLASPAHPMVVQGDGRAPMKSLLTGRGLTPDEVDERVASRQVWLFKKADGLRADMKLDSKDTPRQLLATTGTGLPPPRRLRVYAGAGHSDLGGLIQTQWRVPPDRVDAVLQEATWRAVDVVRKADEVVDSHTLVAVVQRDIAWVDGFMKMVYAENPGAAWGFMRDASPTLRTAFFSIIALIAALGMIWAIWTGWMGSALGTWALGAVLGGAVGNLIDRGMYQVVVDFVLNYVGEYRWPVYNVADIGISVGVVLILLELFVQRGRLPDDEQAPDNSPHSATQEA